MAALVSIFRLEECWFIMTDFVIAGFQPPGFQGPPGGGPRESQSNAIFHYCPLILSQLASSPLLDSSRHQAEEGSLQVSAADDRIMDDDKSHSISRRAVYRARTNDSSLNVLRPRLARRRDMAWRWEGRGAGSKASMIVQNTMGQKRGQKMLHAPRDTRDGMYHISLACKGCLIRGRTEVASK